MKRQAHNDYLYVCEKEWKGISLEPRSIISIDAEAGESIWRFVNY
jgi:hypothetical protein